MDNTLKIVDLDVTEREELERVVVEAAKLGGYLHIEIRKPPIKQAM